MEDRYGESNGLLIYHLHREISNTVQGSMSVTRYFSELKKLWDELNCTEPLPTCYCGATNSISEFF